MRSSGLKGLTGGVEGGVLEAGVESAASCPVVLAHTLEPGAPCLWGQRSCIRGPGATNFPSR